MRSLLYTFVLLLPALVSANNDWDTPCHSGSCSYHMKNSTHVGTSGMMAIVSLLHLLSNDGLCLTTYAQNGSTSAISDLTKAGGWTILDCAKNATAAHSIRAVCHGDDSDCAHPYTNGVLHTIVRLPDDVRTSFIGAIVTKYSLAWLTQQCGNMPFARVTNEWTHENQTLPDHVNATISRRTNGRARSVRGITLDTDFHKIDPKT